MLHFQKAHEIIEHGSMKDLVALYNQYSDKPVKRFSDRKSAERRCRELVKTVLRHTPGDEQIPEPQQDLGPRCPECGSYDHCADGDEVNGKKIRLTHREYECLECGTEFGRLLKDEPVKDDVKAPGIAASWEDAEIRAKRRQRSAVEVDGKQYRSVKAAYIALGLDLKGHIPFRMLLKENGHAKVDGRYWKIIPLNY